MAHIGKNIFSTELEFIPASVKVIEYVQYVYKCPECGVINSSPAVIVKVSVPALIMKRMLASASTVRRYFIEIIPLDNGKEISGSKDSEGRDFYDKLFKIDIELSVLTPENRLSDRQERSKPVLENFLTHIKAVVFN